MGQSAKAVLALLLIVLCGAAAFAWGDPEVRTTIDVALTAAALVPLALLLFAMMRRDKALDFLHRFAGSYFERDGFTFAVQPRNEDGVCQMAILFQNRHSEPCEAQVTIKPSREFFMTRRPIKQVTVGIRCEGGAFGVALVPWGIPKQFQGKKQNIDVGASVRWPNGKGEMLRFRDGIAVKGPKLEALQVTMTVAAAATGMIVLHTPARLSIRLPTEVSENVSDESSISIVTHWRPGQPEDNIQLSGNL